MDSARWDRIQKLFHDAADVPQGEQRMFLEAACGNDEDLIVEVLAMLDQDARGHSLLELAIIDSTGILELVAFLEQRYGIAIADDELAPGNLDSVSRLTTFVQRKLLPAMR